MHALILDAQQRSALAAARSLGHHGVRVHVADSSTPALAGASRYVDLRLQYPDPTLQPEAFTAWVAETARRLSVQVVIPMTDVTTMLLAPMHDDLKPVLLGCGPKLPYEQLSDKGQLLRLASAAGIKTPVTRVLCTLEDLQHHVSSCCFPLVLKPARSKVLLRGRIVSTAVFIARTAQAAFEYLRDQTWFGEMPCLAQEYIEGEGAGVFVLYADGTPVTWFAHRRLREKPPAGGVSVLSESVPVDTMLRDLSERLLSAAGWRGPAMVEYRIAHDGTPFLMEVNCRFWGSLQLSIDSGVDFPWLWYQLLTGKAATAQPLYRSGIRLRWLLGDLDNLLIQMRDQHLPCSSKRRAAGRFLGVFFDVSSTQEILRWSDPGPALHELRAWLRALL